MAGKIHAADRIAVEDAKFQIIPDFIALDMLESSDTVPKKADEFLSGHKINITNIQNFASRPW